tara:strand:+ start:823 stop:1284 length:462 start_codon:yes stop_codon:yes gene_type:complete
MFNIVLLEPQIPPNTGSTGRLCGATNCNLHVVGKLGFELSDRTLKRAGLDYWDNISWKYFKDINFYYDHLIKIKNFHLLTTKSPFSYTSKQFKPGDYLVFGSETKGINEKFLKENWEKTCTIPMMNDNIRSLNLATSVGIVLYEALRQNEQTK